MARRLPRRSSSWRRGDAVILAEANVEPEQLSSTSATVTGCRCSSTSSSTSARSWPWPAARSAPILQALAETPALPDTCQWATFLRNHDEVDLGRLVGHEHDEVFAAFGPDPDMQLYGRGIRRRLAPMLGNDRRRIEMAYALQFSLPGTPVIRYGDEIGMGEDLTLAGAQRHPHPDAVERRTATAGSPRTRRKRDLRRPVITGGEFGYETVNVEDQQRDPASLLGWFQRALLILRECPEFGVGTCPYVDTGERSVLALVHDAPSGAMLAVDQPRRRAVSRRPRSTGRAGRRSDRGLRRPRLPTCRSRAPRHRHRAVRISMDPTTPEHRRPSRILVAALRRCRSGHRTLLIASPPRARWPGSHGASRGQFVAKRMIAVKCG